jgi:hypothetical protein
MPGIFSLGTERSDGNTMMTTKLTMDDFNEYPTLAKEGPTTRKANKCNKTTHFPNAVDVQHITDDLAGWATIKTKKGKREANATDNN